MFKVIVQEETIMDEGTHYYMKTVHETSSEDKQVIAATLRAIANVYDPPQMPGRRGLPTVYRGDKE